MSEIVLVRHGQASFGQSNYDQLSEVGYSQSVWLGEHLRELEHHCDRIVTGTMVRHRQTAVGILKGMRNDIQLDVHAGLDEYDFQGLLDPFRERYPEGWSETGSAKRDYYQNMKSALQCWMSGDIESDGKDSWISFCNRICDALEFVCSGNARRTLVVTSGGPISVILNRMFTLGAAQLCNFMLQIKNTSTSTLLYNRVELTMDSFNNVSHLLKTERRQYITYS